MKALVVVLLPIAVIAGKKDDVVTEKFESGKVRSKTVYQGNDLLEAEAFYENGKPKLTTKRIGKSEKGYGADIYTFKEFDGDGRVASEGTCWGPPLAPINPYEISSKPKLHFGGQYCKEQTGVIRRYDDKGELFEEVQLKNGINEGDSIFIKDGITQKYTYIKGKKSKYTETDRSGKILKSEEYYADGSKK